MDCRRGGRCALPRVATIRHTVGRRANDAITAALLDCVLRHTAPCDSPTSARDMGRLCRPVAPLLMGDSVYLGADGCCGARRRERLSTARSTCPVVAPEAFVS